MKANEKKLNLLFSGISAMSALVVTSIAIWGIFFTSLPEKIISGLKTEVTDAKEELIDLRIEKRSIAEHNKKMASELAKTRQEYFSKIDSLENLKNEHNFLREKINNLKDEESYRINFQYNDLALNFLTKVKSALQSEKRDALYLSNLNDVFNWIESKQPLEYVEKEGSKIVFVDNREKWEEWRSNEPTYMPRKHFQIDIEDPEAHRNYIRNEFSAREVLSFLKILKVNLSNIKYTKIESEAYEKLSARIGIFLENNSAKLALPIGPKVGVGFVDDQIINSGKDSLKLIVDAELKVSELESFLLE